MVNRIYKIKVLIILLLAPISNTFSQDVNSIVKIYSEQKDGNFSQGSGFFTSKNGEILTCYHLIYNSNKIRIIYQNRLYTEIVVKGIAPDYDLALIKINSDKKFTNFNEVNRQELKNLLNEEVWF